MSNSAVEADRPLGATELEQSLSLERTKGISAGFYDYGQGRWYQDSAAIGALGLRDTAWRLESYDLVSRCDGQRVLDLGCYAGFLGLSVAMAAASYVGVDHNPHLLRIGEILSQRTKTRNATFICSDFFGIDPKQICDADTTLLFSSHISYEMNQIGKLENFIRGLIQNSRLGSQLIFESHPPFFESTGPGLDWIYEQFARGYRLVETRTMDGPGLLDRSRTLMVLERG